jgi:hypothetical protein
MIAGQQAQGLAHRRRQLLHLQEGHPGAAGSAFKFIKWITQPERAAQWSMETGYVAVSEKPPMPPTHFASTAATSRLRSWRGPAAVSVAEFSTHDNQRVTKALNDGLQAALTGTKTPAQAMKDAQPKPTACCAPINEAPTPSLRVLRCPPGGLSRLGAARCGDCEFKGASAPQQPRVHPRLAAAAAGAGAAGVVHALAVRSPR